MELTEIWVSIIIPLLIGPICIFAKTVYDNYKMTKFEKMKIEFDEKTRKKMNAEIGVKEDAIDKYMYNFY